MREPVSIIVIAHSNVRTLPKCIESVNLHSNDIDQKILVINNPSTDVVAFSESIGANWLVVREDKLIGPQHARNRGAEFSKHEYLVFLDDDIAIQDGWIELMLSQFSRPQIAMIQGHIQFEKHTGVFWNYLRYKNLGYFQKMRNKDQINMCDTAAIVVKKRWFQAVGGFSKDLRIGEDSYFAYKISRNGGEIRLNTALSVKQILDPEETFQNYFLRCRTLATSVVPLYLKTGRSNHIYLSQFNLKKNKGCRKPIIYWMIHFLLNLYFHVELNASRNLFKAGTEKYVVRKNKDEY